MLFKLILIFSISFPSSSTNKEAIKLYINQHKDIAVAEMHRTGIPASIKMAQALLESQYGISELASNANNHFGIKCGGKWKGGEYFIKDDDYVNGKLVNSCFRKYKSSEESFIAHSDFLSDPAKKYRYGFLFRYDHTDYESWAHGLLDAGYATDKKYPEKLISIIEKYQLYIFDGQAKPSNHSSKKSHKEKPIITYTRKLDNKSREKAADSRTTKKSTKRSKKESPVVSNQYRFKEVNESRLIIAKTEESVQTLAKQNKLSVSDILKYNERLNSSADLVEGGEYIYLEEKSKSYDGAKDHHRVKEGESMYDIAQLYGIKLKSLYAKNRLPLNAQVLTGEKLSLKGRIKLGDRAKFSTIEDTRDSEDKFLF